MFLTFFGKARWDASEHIQHAVHDDHHGDAHLMPRPAMAPRAITRTKARWSMLVPLGVLSVGACSRAFLFYKNFIYAEEGAAFWGGSIAFDAHLMHLAHEVPHVGQMDAVCGDGHRPGIAWYAYIRRPISPPKFVEQFGVLHNFLYRKWYFDEAV